MKIKFKIECVVRVYFKKLLIKIMSLIFKYILSNYILLSLVGDVINVIIYSLRRRCKRTRTPTGAK